MNLDWRKYVCEFRHSNGRDHFAVAPCVESRILVLNFLRYVDGMTSATAKDIARLLPNANDHAIHEIVKSGATIAELDAAVLLLQGDDESTRNIRNEFGDRLTSLVNILMDADILPLDGSEI